METRDDAPKRLYPSSPLVGVGAIVQYKGKILLIRRANEPGKGLWSIPGGLVELGETVRDAAKREVEEETGISVEIGDLIDVIDNIIRDEKGAIKFHYVLVDFLARPLSEEPIIHPSSEALDAGWFSPQELEKLPITKTAQRLLKKLGLLSMP
jgi:mutator protein MutT